MASAVFRVDASLEIGTGHVMRCITLAKALKREGAKVSFISRELPGNIIDRIQSQGFVATRLVAPNGQPPSGRPKHASWAGVSWQRDAEETGAVLESSTPDWLIIDHYALDKRWEKAVRRDGMRIMAVDDLADRPHHCDLLLDQNLGREASDYKDLVPEHCKLLIGPRYALLRPEFAAQRSESLARRRQGELKHILVSMGGIDLVDATSTVLAAIRTCNLPENARMSVIMGHKAPALERVKVCAENMPCPTEVAVDVHDMAARMATTDLAISAAGTTTWERCCLGLPSVSVQIAENQSEINRAIVTSGAALDPGPIHSIDFARKLQSAVSEATDSSRLAEMSACAAIICDGKGVERVVRHILPIAHYERYLARPASLDDAHDIWRWRNADSSTKFYRNPSTTPFAEHMDWFRKALSDPDRILLIIERDGMPLGHVRLDRDEKTRECAEISIYVNPEFRGQGHGKEILKAAMQAGASAGVMRFSAEIHEDNAASLHIFSKLGFRPDVSEGEFLSMTTD